MPWYFIGALHMRESSCNFAGVLHNGEHIIGTGRKTKLVPAGRGPFKTWEDAAVDALQLKGLQKYAGQWSAALMGYVSEIFNGLGYTKKGVNSAYLWAGSNHEQRGKYVADHVWDKDFDDPQIGTMTVLKRIAELRPDVAADLNGAEPVVEKKPVTLKDVAVSSAATAGAGTVAAGVQQGWGWQEWGLLALAVILACGAAYGAWRGCRAWRASRARATLPAVEAKPQQATPLLDAALQEASRRANADTALAARVTRGRPKRKRTTTSAKKVAKAKAPRRRAA